MLQPLIITPPQKSVPEGRRPSRATALRSNASPRDVFLRGGLKENDQKKYTLEVKTVKARKSE